MQLVCCCNILSHKFGSHLLNGITSEAAKQWRHQRSKGARSFQGQKMLQPGQPDALIPQKKLTTIILVVALKTQATNVVSPSK